MFGIRWHLLGRLLLPGPVLLPVPLLMLAGCGDLDTGPSVSVGSEDPVVSLYFSERLPTLPALAERWAPGLGLDPILGAWQGSWELPPEEGATRRQDAVEAATAIMEGVVPRSALDQAFRQVDEALRAAETALGATFATHPGEGVGEGPEVALLTGPLARAAQHRDLAQAAREEGGARDQLRHVLLAADALRATTADALALVFMEQAETGLRRILEADAYAQVTVERVERLLAGAREALAVGQATLALQRAWYAVGLVRASEALGGVDPDEGRPGNRDSGLAGASPSGGLTEEME